MSGDTTDWRAVGAEPIRPENPCGDPVRYEPEFEQLQAEIQKLESLSGGAIDWSLVVKLSREILAHKSKDLLVCSYLAAGLAETEGYRGCLNGLTCLEGLVAAHWDSLYPEAKRMRARINALGWLSEKGASILSRREAGPNDRETLVACEERIKALEARLEEKASPEEPAFGDMARQIQEKLSRLPAAGEGQSDPARQPESSTPAQPSPVSVSPAPAPAAAQAGKIDTVEDARRFLKETFIALKKIASFSRSQDLSQPLPYRLIRFLTWCEIDSLPPAENGKSRVPPPPKQLRDRLQALAEQSSWRELVIQAEAGVSEFPFWIDLHRMSATALASLGPDYISAKNAIHSEVATLLGRLPDLAGIEFSDGTPFADASTRDWISTRIFPEKSAEPAPAPPAGNETDFLEEVRSKSRRLIEEGDAKAALSLVQEFSRSAPSRRRKFLAQLELANLCIEAGHPKAALVHFEELDEQITQFSLDVWEPQLASQVLQIYHRTIVKALRETKHPEPELSRTADSVYSRLCRLDVLAGLNALK